MKNQTGSQNTLVISYLVLRKAIGILGTALPFLLFSGALIFFRTGLQSSMSYYYHTGMRDVFVGILFVIGFFLFSYRGYEPVDNLVGDFGCAFAVGLALFPTAPDAPVSNGALLIGYIHLAFAALFFITLTIFSLFLFTKTHKDRSPTKRKLTRNKIYRVCGYVMMLCLALIVVYSLFFNKETSSLNSLHPVFWLEGLAVMFFGISWLIKGETLFKDKK